MTVFSTNKAINAEIHRMMPFFSDTSQRRIRKELLSSKRSLEKHRDENTDAGARHVFRALIPAKRLNENGWSLEYNVFIDGKTPDWLDLSAGLLLEAYTYERYGASGFNERVVEAVTDKCRKYAQIAADNNLGILVSVYLDFITCMTLEECQEEAKAFRPLFGAYAALRGVLFFTEKTVQLRGVQQYDFLCITTDPTLDVVANWPFNTELLD